MCCNTTVHVASLHRILVFLYSRLHAEISVCNTERLQESTSSVHLRTVSVLLARGRLAATYRACLWSIRACTMTSPDSSHIQATAARLHGCKNGAKYVSQWVPTLFSGEFRKLNNETLTLGMIVDDLSRRLFIATFVFQLCARDRAVRGAEMAFLTSIYLLRCCL